MFEYHSLVRTCAQCSRVFRPSSGHLRCPACRSRDICDCGNLKQKHSVACIKCSSQALEFNGHWRGGKTRHKAGYIMVRLPGHPRAKTGGGYYVFEHILVMEDHLGRHLFPDESIHHINGVRDDNRIENLELWVKAQPAGIRVEDAVDWAREILARYTGDWHASNSPPT